MKFEDAVKFFGTSANIARILDMSAAALRYWHGGLIPLAYVRRLAAASGGQLTYSLEAYLEEAEKAAEIARKARDERLGVIRRAAR